MWTTSRRPLNESKIGAYIRVSELGYGAISLSLDLGLGAIFSSRVVPGELVFPTPLLLFS